MWRPAVESRYFGAFLLNDATLLFVGSARLLGRFALKMFAEGETYAPEAEMSFLSSLVPP